MCVNLQNKKKLRCFLEKFTQRTKILHDCRSRQISSLFHNINFLWVPLTESAERNEETKGRWNWESERKGQGMIYLLFFFWGVIIRWTFKEEIFLGRLGSSLAYLILVLILMLGERAAVLVDRKIFSLFGLGQSAICTKNIWNYERIFFIAEKLQCPFLWLNVTNITFP